MNRLWPALLLLLTSVVGAQTTTLSTTVPTTPPAALVVQGPLLRAAKLDKAAPLYWRDGRQRFAIGRVLPDGTLNFSLDTALQGRARLGSLADWKASRGRSCDVSALVVEQDAPVQYLGAPEYDAGGKKYYVRAGEVTRNTGGGLTLNFVMFVYAQAPGRMVGTERCDDGVTHYDLTLQPGWNAVEDVQELDTNDQFGPVTLRNARVITAYTGPWVSFELK
ncbi:hypothetical protein [Deinococcus arcticus]|uniref:hypothetical protein n=1 Tax=Deinococcus arcticus TaxID=2136176 RepID=UPI0011B21B7B|nr:hypothetical protein [Deinococcus arcticus]